MNKSNRTFRDNFSEEVHRLGSQHNSHYPLLPLNLDDWRDLEDQVTKKVMVPMRRTIEIINRLISPDHS